MGAACGCLHHDKAELLHLNDTPRSLPDLIRSSRPDEVIAFNPDEENWSSGSLEELALQLNNVTKLVRGGQSSGDVTNHIATQVLAALAAAQNLVRQQQDTGQQQQKVPESSIHRRASSENLERREKLSQFKRQMKKRGSAVQANFFTSMLCTDEEASESPEMTPKPGGIIPWYKSIENNLRFTSIGQEKLETELLSPNFDALQVPEHLLIRYAVALFETSGLAEHYNMDKIKMKACFTALAGTYRNNPYHNFRHGLDCAQAVYYMVRSIPTFLSWRLICHVITRR